MPRGAPKKRSSGRLQALPWLGILRAAVVVGEGFGRLSAKDRARLTELVRRSHGWPGALSGKEREELRALAGKLDLKKMSRQLVPIVRRRGKRRRGR